MSPVGEDCVDAGVKSMAKQKRIRRGRRHWPQRFQKKTITWNPPKPTCAEIKLAREGDFDLAVLRMSKRLKLHHPVHAIVALNPHKEIHLESMAIPIGSVIVSTKRTKPLCFGLRGRKMPEWTDLVVRVTVERREFEIFRQCIGGYEGIIGHTITAAGIRARIKHDCPERKLV